MPNRVTVVVHGTYAAEEDWWLPGDRPGKTFADKLEDALAKRGRAGTVWAPVAAAKMDVRTFRWSGANTHAARVAGARNLAERLEELARATGATRKEPLVADFVAHSHGGNVVLEALRRTHAHVRCEEIVLLGTPLLRRRPVLRPLRFFLGLSIMGLVITIALFASIVLIDEPAAALLVLLLPLVSGWVFLAVAELIDVVWATPVFLARAATGRTGGPCYGPGTRRLRRMLDGRKILLVTSRYDEAELVVGLGCAPLELYDSYVRRLRLPMKLVHWIVLRPVVHGFLEAVEAMTERVALGFSLPQVLFFDHGLAHLSSRWNAYPPAILDRRDVTRHLQSLVGARAVTDPITLSLNTTGSALLAAGEAGAQVDLAHKLDEVRKYFHDQISLRHSLYHESQAVIELVADRLTGGLAPNPASEPRVAAS